MSGTTILTKHPQGKSGRNISKQMYDVVKKALLESLKGRELTHAELLRAVGRRLKGRFEGNINWYGETVKLDLEARKVIQRTGSTPVRYTLKRAAR
jgi:hypothetical protein